MSSTDQILEFSFSTGGHFEKWPNHAVSPNFFTGNMWNLNQMSPLNKIIPLAEVLGVGGGGCMGPIEDRGLYTVKVNILVLHLMTLHTSETSRTHNKLIVHVPRGLCLDRDWCCVNSARALAEVPIKTCPRGTCTISFIIPKNANIYVNGFSSGVHTFIAHSGDNWQTLTNLMEKKGTMAAHTLELPRPDGGI